MSFIRPAESVGTIDPQTTVHLAVHVQAGFFNPSCPRPSEERRQPIADKVAARIERTASSLRETGIPTFWIRMTDDEGFEISEEAAELYKVNPGEGDETLEDFERSAIKTADTLTRLRERGIETLLVSGGYASECVTDTVNDALKEGFRVVVMTDCLLDNQDDMDLKGMFGRHADKTRAVFSNSDNVLKSVSNADRFMRQNALPAISASCSPA